MNKPPKFGQTALDHMALDRLRGIKDDNHALPADETRALQNFKSFAPEFFDSQREFLRRAETQEREG